MDRLSRRAKKEAMKILITGHLGTIGSIICPRLTSLGFEIEGYDLRNGDDILDTQKLAERLKGRDACLHLAGIPSPTADPWEEYVKTNINGTDSVIKACEMVEIKRLVYMSSGAVYGFSRGLCSPSSLPLKEDDLPPKENLCFYDVSKLECEKHLRKAATAWMTTIALRIETPSSAPIIPTHLYVSISDENLTEGIRAALQADFEGFGVFNIADPIIPSSIDVDIQKWISEAYPKIPCSTTGRETLFDISRAKKLLGYKPIEGGK